MCKIANQRKGWTMGLVTLKKILDTANQGGYAVPAFDTVDHASAEGIIMAAEEKNKEVILMVPEAGLPFVDMDRFFPFLVNLAQQAKVPVALELDHGKTFEVIMKAIHYGFSSVMIDGSDLSFEENVKITKKVVEVAHAAGISVEGEIGHVAGAEGAFSGSKVDKSMYTKVEDAVSFVKETKVDALAVAFGTVHGIYKGTPQLDVDLLKSIKDQVEIPLVMHGGSGVSDEEFIKAIENGINKINLFTEISMAAVNQSVIHCQKKENMLHFAELILVGKKTVKAIALRYIDLFSL